MSTHVTQRLMNKLNDPKKEMQLIREGLKPHIVETFLDEHDLFLKEVLKKLSIPISTYFNRKKTNKALDAYTSEKFIRLISVIKLASEILGEGEAKTWLYRKIPSLGNEIPLDLLDTEPGHRLVTQALYQIKYGIYS